MPCHDDVLPAIAGGLLRDGRGGAELQPHGATRFVGRHAAGDQRLDGLFEEMLDLVADVPIGGVPVHEPADAARQLTPERHSLGLGPQQPGDGRGAARPVRRLGFELLRPARVSV